MLMWFVSSSDTPLLVSTLNRVILLKWCKQGCINSPGIESFPFSVGATALSRAHFGAGSGSIFMNNVACTLFDTQLTSCYHTPYHNCGHSEDASVRCPLIRQPRTTGYAKENTEVVCPHLEVLFTGCVYEVSPIPIIESSHHLLLIFSTTAAVRGLVPIIPVTGLRK